MHNIEFGKVADLMEDAIGAGFFTIGGGGDFPRNVMVSPLTGVQRGENFDVFPYAEKAAEYLISQIDKVKMPRKLKVGFSNSSENVVHATFRDLGFVSRADGLFDVYCAGGMGMNPKMGVKVDDAVDGAKLIYYIKAMIALFCEYGNYENRSRARTRYMQDVLDDRLAEEFKKKLDEAIEDGGLDIEVRPSELTKTGKKADITSERLTEQKQNGLYSVLYHPTGGILSLDSLKKIYETIKDMDAVSLRITPEEGMYIINCDGDEALRVLDVTAESGEKDIELSVACIGASICQQGLRDSQALLRDILEAVKPYDFAPKALPKLHISGCMSSCGTHEIGEMGFHGKVKLVDKKPLPGFTISLNGCDEQGRERFGDDMGVMASDDIPRFMVELGKSVTAAKMTYKQYAAERSDELIELVKKYI
jgi:ferredoxin-nitrite reductase